MAYFRSVKESGGGDTEPTFSTTTLFTGSGYGDSSYVLSDDYHNYDFLKVTLYNDNDLYYNYQEFTFSPTDLDELCLTKELHMGFFPHMPVSTRGTCINVTDNTTLARQWYRDTFISKIEGIKCTNKTVTPTILYSGRHNSGILILSDNVKDYDLVSMCSGSGNRDEIGPFIMKPFVDDVLNSSTFLCSHGYNNTNGPLYFSNDGINFSHYCSGIVYVVTGYKFT